jgi:DNA end-binding protein Ku
MPKHTSHQRRQHSEAHAGSEPVRHGPRPTWSGSLSFGLVTIPVELHSAIRPRRRRARMLDEEGALLRRRFYCPEDGKTLDDSEIVRGYELPNGKYVVVEDDELEALEPKKSREIDLRLFTDRSTLAPVTFEHAYVLIPASEGNKAYRLLTQVMQRTQRAGIATFVMREREYIIAIVSDGRCLLAETLRFADELRPVSELNLPKPGAAPKPLAARIERALSSKRARHVDAKKLVDPAHARLEKLIDTKRRSGKVVTPAVAESAEEEHGGAEVIDLMQLLKGSLRGRGQKSAATNDRAKTRHARAPSKRRAATAGKHKRAG